MIKNKELEILKSFLELAKDTDKKFELLYTHQLCYENLRKLLDKAEILTDQQLQSRIDFINNLNTALEDYIKTM